MKTLNIRNANEAHALMHAVRLHRATVVNEFTGTEARVVESRRLWLAAYDAIVPQLDNIIRLFELEADEPPDAPPVPCPPRPRGAGRPWTYANQFPAEYAPPAELLAAFAANDWSDASWGNDASPHFARGGSSIWFDHPEPTARECGGKRFTLTKDDGDGGLETLAETDDVTVAVGWCA